MTSEGKGILGTVLAFFTADEEQGRKTLHCHWQIWVKEINKTLHICLFHEDDTIRDIARKTFWKQIDNVITAGYGSEFCITHKCVNKKMILSISKTWLKYYFKSKTHIFFGVHVTKNYVDRFSS
jgi:hypothetical protein